MTELGAEQPIAWGALQPGADVISADGEKVGEVTEVVGDSSVDIFSGVAFKQGLLDQERMIPADSIERITPAAIHLTLSSTETESLGTYDR